MEAPTQSRSAIAVPVREESIPRLPWQLERLVRAASSGVLEAEVPGVIDVQRYTLAWGVIYLSGDKDEALNRLWTVYQSWERVN